jgi:signal peptidase I
MFDVTDTLWVTIKGKSMFPALADNSVARITHCNAAHLHCGDIVVFIHDGQLIAHRLFRKLYRNGSLVFKVKGDTVFTFDPAVAQDNLLAKVTAVKYSGITIGLDNWCMRGLGLACAWIMPFIARLKCRFTNGQYGIPDKT